MSFIYPDLEEQALYNELWSELDLVVKPGSAVLEVGCGDAQVLHALCKSKACRGAGSDPFIETAKGNPAFFALTAEETDLIPMDFNVIYGAKCLHHMQDMGLFFEKAYGKLLPGGYLIIADWTYGMDRGFGETYHRPENVLKEVGKSGFTEFEVRVRPTHLFLFALKR